MSDTVLVVIIVIAVLALVVIAAAMRARGRRDGVASFRRQIDALSPEARRPVRDQVQNAAERRPDVTDEAADGERGDSDGLDEGGARGA